MRNIRTTPGHLSRFVIIGLAAGSFLAMTTIITTGFNLFASSVPSVEAGSEFECSNATLRGSYSFTSEGWVPNGPPSAPLVPFATASRMSLDGAGGVANDITVSRNGEIIRNLGKGTYSIGRNCKGKMTFDAPPGIPFKLEFDVIVTHKGEGFDSISTNGGGVVKHEAKRIHPGL